MQRLNALPSNDALTSNACSFKTRRTETEHKESPLNCPLAGGETLQALLLLPLLSAPLGLSGDGNLIATRSPPS